MTIVTGTERGSEVEVDQLGSLYVRSVTEDDEIGRPDSSVTISKKEEAQPLRKVTGVLKASREAHTRQRPSLVTDDHLVSSSSRRWPVTEASYNI
jgi:hypothetical protein